MIPESISAIYYLLGERGWIFQIVMALIGLCLLPFWLDITPDEWQVLPFLSCISLLFIAVAPQFRLQLDGVVHYTSAIICGICAVLWMFIQGYINIFLLCLAGVIIPVLYDPKKYMWWLEISIMISLLLNIIFYK